MLEINIISLIEYPAKAKGNKLYCCRQLKLSVKVLPGNKTEL